MSSSKNSLRTPLLVILATLGIGFLFYQADSFWGLVTSALVVTIDGSLAAVEHSAESDLEDVLLVHGSSDGEHPEPVVVAAWELVAAWLLVTATEL